MTHARIVAAAALAGAGIAAGIGLAMPITNLMAYARIVIVAALAGASIAAAGTALAMPITNLPPEESQGAVSYRTGGIGEAEARAMRLAESQYPLSLEFLARAKPRDEFLAYVQVTIKDKDGKTALDTYSDGPIALVELPDGKYTVKVTDEGVTRVRQVTIAPGKPQHLVFEW